jgi:selenophosphate synthetase-related protein
VQHIFNKYEISCSSIGKVTTGSKVNLVSENQVAVLWDFNDEPFTGFSSSSVAQSHEYKEELLN